MFTGIIQEKVPLKAARWAEDGASCLLEIQSSHARRRAWNVGDSVSIDGACLTIVQIEHGEESSRFSFDVSRETLEKTHLGASLKTEHPRLQCLHLEPALRFGDALGGHLVSGHVEGLVVLEKIKPQGEYLEFTFSVARAHEISSFLISKGSIALDGVSLTVNQVWDLRAQSGSRTFFSVLLIPHTLEQCHFSLLREGDFVNAESDLIARHFCRYQEQSL